MKTLIAISRITDNYNHYITYKKEYTVHKIVFCDNEIQIIIINDENNLRKIKSTFFNFREED